MRKIGIILLLLPTILIVGCHQGHNDPKIELYLDGSYYGECIYQHPAISSVIKGLDFDFVNNKYNDVEPVVKEAIDNFFDGASLSSYYENLPIDELKSVDEIVYYELDVENNVSSGLYIFNVNKKTYAFAASCNNDEYEIMRGFLLTKKNLTLLETETVQVEYSLYEEKCNEYAFMFKQGFYAIDNYDDYLKFYMSVSKKDIEPLDKEGGENMFKDIVILCYARIVSYSINFIPVEYSYDEDRNQIVYDSIYKPSDNVEFPCVVVAYCFDFVTVPKNIYYSLVGKSDENSYNVTVTGSTHSLMEQLASSYQAGTKIEIKAYPVTDITLYVFVNGVEVKMSHFDFDYWGYEFIMPEEDVTIHLTYDQFYGKDDYTFSDLYYWVDNLKNVDKVAIYNKANGNSKFSEIYYMSNASDISRMLDILKQPLEKYETEFYGPQYDDIIPIEFNTTIIYYVGEQSYSLNFINNILCWNDFSTSQRFNFKDPSYLVPNAALEYDLKTYKFEYDGLSSDIKKVSNEEFVDRFFYIDSIEFVEYTGALDDVVPKYYLDSRYGKILLHTATVFELNNKYYEIISGSEYWAYNYLK